MKLQKLTLAVAAILAIAVPVRAHEPEKQTLRNDRERSQARSDIFGSRPYLGASLMKLTPQLRDHYGVKAGGALVTSVDADSPASKAGIRAGDVIVSVDGKQVERSRDLTKAIRDRKAGEEVRIELVRGGRPQQTAARIVERESRLEIPFDAAVFEEIGPVAIEAADQMFRMVSSPEFRATMSELQARVRELEARLKDLENKTEN